MANAGDQVGSKRKHVTTALDIPGTDCFSFNSSLEVVTRPKRAKFSQTRRQEVNKVKAIGACLRCQLMKKPVDEARCPRFVDLLNVITVLRHKALQAVHPSETFHTGNAPQMDGLHTSASARCRYLHAWYLKCSASLCLY